MRKFFKFFFYCVLMHLLKIIHYPKNKFFKYVSAHNVRQLRKLTTQSKYFWLHRLYYIYIYIYVLLSNDSSVFLSLIYTVTQLTIVLSLEKYVRYSSHYSVGWADVMWTLLSSLSFSFSTECCKVRRAYKTRSVETWKITMLNWLINIVNNHKFPWYRRRQDPHPTFIPTCKCLFIRY